MNHFDVQVLWVYIVLLLVGGLIGFGGALLVILLSAFID